MLNHLEKAFWTIGDKMLSDTHSYHSSEVKPKIMTNELVIKPIANTREKKVETKQSLEELTKKELCDLAAERFGVDLSLRSDKATLIAQFLYEQG